MEYHHVTTWASLSILSLGPTFSSAGESVPLSAATMPTAGAQFPTLRSDARLFVPQRLFRQIALAACLFCLPALYIQDYPEAWTSKLSAAASLPSPRDAVLLVKGLSFTQHPIDGKNSFTEGRVALCIAGHLRSFGNAAVHNSIKRRVIHVLEIAGWKVDVFFYVGRDDVPKGRTSVAQPGGTYDVIRSFKPVRVLHFPNDPTDCPTHNCTHARQGSVPCPHALLRAHQCVATVKEYELENGLRYQWVYKTRPDVAFGSDISVPQELMHDVVYMNQHIPGTSTHAHQWLRSKFLKNATVLNHAVADHVVIASREVAELVHMADDAYRDCRLYELPSGTLNSEVGLTYWVAQHGIRYKTLPWFWMLVRDAEGPECARVQYIRDENGKHNADLTRKCEEFRKTGVIPEWSD